VPVFWPIAKAGEDSCFTAVEEGMEVIAEANEVAGVTHQGRDQPSV
jgi:hypothetical protein